MHPRLEEDVEYSLDEEFKKIDSWLHLFKWLSNLRASRNGMDSGHIYVLGRDSYCKIYRSDEWMPDHVKNIEYTLDCQTFVGNIISETIEGYEHCIGFIGIDQEVIDILESFCLEPIEPVPYLNMDKYVIYNVDPDYAF